jgi:hypothetical protein
LGNNGTGFHRFLCFRPTEAERCQVGHVVP